MENKKKRKYDLQDRLINYSVKMIHFVETLPNTKTGNHISNQLLQSGTSPAPNYGEAQSAESRSDFIHKLKIALKELRESEVWLKIIFKAKLFKSDKKIKELLQETDEVDFVQKCYNCQKPKTNLNYVN